MPASQHFKSALKAKARELGFEACGIATATALPEEKSKLEAWLAAGFHGSMAWMEGHFEKRTDPRLLVPGAKTIVSVLQSYYHPIQPSEDPSIGRISRYALGDDYHLVMKEKLAALIEWMRQEAGPIEGRAFVDSAPVMDKVWAAKAGLGWIGKHSNLISPDHGSWFFIGELIIDLDIPPDLPIADHCGSCTKCLDACPTAAIVEPYVVDGSKCISYGTIEHRGNDLPEALTQHYDNWIFGCDICQEVCPWNKFRTESAEAKYAPREGLLNKPLSEWAEMDQESFSATFRKNPVKRTKHAGLLRNVGYATQNAARVENESDE